MTAWTSMLSVDEALVLRRVGLEPITQVLGSSIYKMGWQQMPWTMSTFGGGFGGGYGRQGRQGGTFELEQQTEAWNAARQLAVGRLRDEAVAAGADAVVGVRTRRHKRDFGTDLVEFVVTGTAVRAPSLRGLSDDGSPLLCNLSGQDVAKLAEHGFRPVGIVGGSTVAYVASSSRQNWRANRMFSGNQELEDFSQGLYDARALAMGHLERGAHELHSHGVVGVSFDRSQREIERDVNDVKYHDLIFEIHVLGTAIVEVEHSAPIPEKYISLPLNR